MGKNAYIDAIASGCILCRMSYCLKVFPVFLVLLFTACSGNNREPMTDRDGNSYHTVTIGGRVWAAENLTVSRYRNGDSIPEVNDPGKWSGLTDGAWCWYSNNSENGKSYGKLYNWYAVNDPRGLAPEGWHVATDGDWSSLSEALGGDEVSGGKLKADRFWKEADSLEGKSGMALLPSGARRDTDGEFVLMGEYSRHWTSSEINAGRAWAWAVGYFDKALRRGEAAKRLGFAVRCVKD